ncbi:hypothetical protein Q4S45_03890 [Massilia sp. R2A-15]|uniref:hypothetical protein n=1 Tax=Massilia sp. R2A-15 TaxID=3064278 RepID=UPI002735608F|nr:hypothetical protein [Massilia sp. R2A-15]WLI90277.1 hypothetical protein Q4S45_03890 [Massilia sp. R2A-15]
MNDKANDRVFGIDEAARHLSGLVKAACEGPVRIGDDGKAAVYLVSKHDFDAMLDHVEEITDALWLARAELAEQGGYVEGDALALIVGRLEEIENAAVDAQQGG